MCSSEKRGGPEFQSPRARPTKTRTASPKKEPGILAVLRSVSRRHLTIDSQPLLPIVNDRPVCSVLVLVACRMRCLVKPEKRITRVGLPAVGSEDPLHLLRTRV